MTTNKIMNAEKIERIEKILLENRELALDICREVNLWNGELDNFDVWENDDEFFNINFSDNPMEAVRAVYYGNYNYNDEYIRVNAYGNIDSLDQWELEKEVEIYINDIIEAMIRNYSHISIYNDELIELIESIISDEIIDTLELMINNEDIY